MKRWSWSVDGTEVASGTIARPLRDAGTVEAELAGDVMKWLTDRGPFWDNLDATQPFNVHIAPSSSEETS